LIKLFRGIIKVDESDEDVLIWENFKHLSLETELEFAPADQRLFNHIQDYIIQFKSPPTMTALRDRFSEDSAIEFILKEVEGLPFRKGAEYQQLILLVKEDQQKDLFKKVVLNAGAIAFEGLKVGKQYLKGIRDAYGYILRHHDTLYVANTLNVKTRGDVREDTEAEIAAYLAEEANPNKVIGIITGIDDIDNVVYGLKKGELMCVSAYSGHGKTTFCLNYAYFAAVYLGYNVVYYSLEMPYSQVRDIFYCMHSSYKDFRQINPPLEYDKIKNRKLSEEEKDFYLNVVLPDFARRVRLSSGSLVPDDDSDPYGSIRVIQPVGSVTPRSLRAEVEAMHQSEPIDILFIDYPNLMEADNAYGQRRDNLNTIIRELKQIAMTFNGGEGLPLVIPFQISTKGYEEARRNNGIYTPDHIAETSEVLKSSDLVVAIYCDEEERQLNQARIMNLKHRDGALFKPAYMYANLASRYMGAQPEERIELTLDRILDAGFSDL